MLPRNILRIGCVTKFCMENYIVSVDIFLFLYFQAYSYNAKKLDKVRAIASVLEYNFVFLIK